MALLEIDGFCKKYHSQSERVIIFDGLSLSVDEHTVVTLLGRSGIGKTTLLRAISGLDLDHGGRITIRGQAVTEPHRDVGLVFQDNRLLPWKRVWNNVAFSLPSEHSDAQRAAAVETALGLVGLAGAGRRWPRELSGGMSKRVAVARALAPEPSIILLDEPFAGLDPKATSELGAHLVHLARIGRATVIIVMHNVDDAIQLSDRVVVLGGAPARLVGDIGIDSEMRNYYGLPYASVRRALISQLSQ